MSWPLRQKHARDICKDKDTAALAVYHACCGYEAGHPVIRDLSFELRKGEVLCVLGTNGIGKTTLFKSVLGHLPLLGGSVRLFGKDINKIQPRDLARIVGYVPQAHIPPFPFTVGSVVAMGRTAHLSVFSTPSRGDELIAFDALERLGMGKLYDRLYTEISGGERQMVLIARALAQDTHMLVMDEPTANLDFGNQLRILERIMDLADSGLAVLMTTHAPDHALLCSSRCLAIKKSDLFVAGNTDEIVTSDLLQEMYGADVEVTLAQTSKGSIKTCVPLLQNRRSDTVA